MKKLIFTAVFMAATCQAFAMAGFAERWLEGWVNDLFWALTVAAVQFILICCVFIARNRLTQTAIFKICAKISTHGPTSIVIGGLLFSFVISAYLNCICGAFFFYGIFPLLSLWILDWLFAFIPSWRKKVTSANAILYLGVMSIAIPIAYAFYYYVVRFEWFTSLYSYSYTDSSLPEFPFTIHSTRLPRIIDAVIYTLIFYLPWLLCAFVKTVKYIRNRYQRIRKNTSGNDAETYIKR